MRDKTITLILKRYLCRNIKMSPSRKTTTIIVYPAVNRTGDRCEQRVWLASRLDDSMWEITLYIQRRTVTLAKCDYCHKHIHIHFIFIIEFSVIFHGLDTQGSPPDFSAVYHTSILNFFWEYNCYVCLVMVIIIK